MSQLILHPRRIFAQAGMDINTAHAQLLAGLLCTIAVAALVAHHWPRVRPFHAQPRPAGAPHRRQV
jgi:ABC-type Fe3+ transport system permease subunit